MDDQVFNPVEPQSTYEETLNRLGTAIRLGVLRPGERLPPERELAERMRISRSTLRQALAVLTGSGHLVAVRGRSGGTFVADAPPVVAASRPEMLERYDELLGYRTAVEVGAAMLAAECGGPRLGELERALTRQRAVPDGDVVAYLRADSGFHLALTRVAGNRRLEREMTELQGETQELMAVSIRDRGGIPEGLMAESLRQHEAIAAAVGAGEVVEAAELVRAHMRLFGSSMPR